MRARHGTLRCQPRPLVFTRPLAAMLLGAGLFVPAGAMVTRLDDSASPRAQVSIDFRQAQPVDANTLALPLGRVEYRLATAPHIGRRARIFYVVPFGIAGLRSPSGLQVVWRAQGTFADGAARPGERVPVWNGVVQTPWMSETLELQLRIDPRLLNLGRGGALSFESYFEIETLP